MKWHVRCGSSKPEEKLIGLAQRSLFRLELMCVGTFMWLLSGTLWASPLIDPTALVGGVTQNQLARQYVEWAESQPNSLATDLLTNTRNASPVAFLPSTYLPSANYSLRVDAGTPLFLPILYMPVWFDNDQSTDPPPCDTATDRVGCFQSLLRDWVGVPSQLLLRVDGATIPISDAHRVDSNGVSSIVALDATNYFGLGAVSVNMIYDGWFAALTALAPGEHVIEYGFEYPNGGVLQTANLTVVPTPALPALLLIGCLGLGAARSHKPAHERTCAQRVG